jgi:hypothetical protein
MTVLEFISVKKEGGSHLSKNRLNRVAMDFSPLAASWSGLPYIPGPPRAITIRLTAKLAIR